MKTKKIEYLSVLFQPIEDKSVWKTVTKVIKLQNQIIEIKKYMNNMFEWIKRYELGRVHLIYMQELSE